MSGREAWLEKYSDYNRMARSVSYYNKGELLGYLLDLGIRHASHNQAGLDELMRSLNRDYARRGRFYTLSDLTAIVAQLAPTFDMNGFIADDVRGIQELDYSAYLGYAGLNLTSSTSALPVPGFSASRNSRGLLEVDSIDTGSDAERAGLQQGDVLLMADGNPLPVGADLAIPTWRPGHTVELQIVRGGDARNIKFRIGINEEISLQIEEDSMASADQLHVRNGWLKGVTNPPAGNR
jgi:predicted metalloprotease with PDZ domain